MMDLREARYFLAVAEELHFGRAADRLHMSQPPLSQAIKALERRLGVELLSRNTRAVSLTAAGAVLVGHCRRLLNAAEAADVAVHQAAEGQLGQLRIGAVTSAFFDPIPVMLAKFRRRYPLVTVELHEMDTHAAIPQLRDDSIDLALVRLLATPSGMARESLLVENFVLAVPAAWREPVDAGPIDLATVADLPWIWLPRQVSPDYHDQVVACCRGNGFAPSATHTASSIVSQLAMVGCGLGVALVPESAANTANPSAHANIRFVTFRGSATIELAAVWPTERRNPAVYEFLGLDRSASRSPEVTV